MGAWISLPARFVVTDAASSPVAISQNMTLMIAKGLITGRRA